MPKRKSTSESPDSVVSFEDSLGELQMIVTELEDGAIGLETSLARFERGIQLLRTCYAVLEAAEARVEILTKFQGESPVIESFEATATYEVAREKPDPADGNTSAESTLF